jgi:hypothetical protein
MSALRTAAAVGAALLIASCSSKQAPSSPTPTDESPPAHGSLADCLKANGVTESGSVPVVLGPPAGVDKATWDTAMKACSSLAPGPAAP